SLVEDDSHPGMHELALVLPEVVGAQAQLAVPAVRDEHAQQHVGLGAAPIAAISRRQSDRCHVMPPCGWPFLVSGAEMIDPGVHQVIEEAQLCDLTRLVPLHSPAPNAHGLVGVLMGHQKVSDSALGNDPSARSTDVKLRVPRTFLQTLGSCWARRARCVHFKGDPWMTV